jgi:hypothetical protein
VSDDDDEDEYEATPASMAVRNMRAMRISLELS